ncbi:hypothetical protein [Pusillimonas sp.]|nr:hypothetical protein [Pusillimonas sp.]MDX3896219.1 hypothetical protein [Pusillimonas sp.]
MNARVLFSILRIVGYLVLLLMLAAIVYASATGIRYWSGIGV